MAKGSVIITNMPIKRMLKLIRKDSLYKTTVSKF